MDQKGHARPLARLGASPTTTHLYSFKYVPNEYLVLTLTVQTRAERPCSRYAQVAVTVA